MDLGLAAEWQPTVALFADRRPREDCAGAVSLGDASSRRESVEPHYAVADGLYEDPAWDAGVGHACPYGAGALLNYSYKPLDIPNVLIVACSVEVCVLRVPAEAFELAIGEDVLHTITVHLIELKYSGEGRYQC